MYFQDDAGRMAIDGLDHIAGVPFLVVGVAAAELTDFDFFFGFFPAKELGLFLFRDDGFDGLVLAAFLPCPVVGDEGEGEGLAGVHLFQAFGYGDDVGHGAKMAGMGRWGKDKKIRKMVTLV